MKPPRKRPPSKETQAMDAALARRGLLFTKGSLGPTKNATAADKQLRKRMDLYAMERMYS
jgi:hypothetical protein